MNTIKSCRFWVLCFAFALSLGAYAQEQTDSTANNETLKEVVVEGYSSHIEPGKVCYTPSAKAIKAAPDGIQLLRLMDFPTINVNPQTYEVTSVTGNAVSYFVNGIAASIYEVIALQPKEIKSIEYMELPSDPKFEGAKVAINYIVVEYEYGGYTKASATKSEPNNDGSGYVYSKFKYKNMAYDVNINGNYSDSHHDVQNSTEHFGAAGLTRQTDTPESLLKSKVGNIALRAIYNKTDNVIVANTIGFGVSNPKSCNTTAELYSNGYYDERQTSSSTRSRFVTWLSNINIDLGKMWSMHLAPTVQYSYGKGSFDFSIPDNYAYGYGTKEHTSAVGFKGGAIKQYNSGHTLYLDYHFKHTNNRVSYTEDVSAKDRFATEIQSIDLGYSYQNSHFYIVPDVAFCYYYDKINNKKNDEFYVVAHLKTQYAFTRKKALTFALQYNTLAPSINIKNAEIIRNDKMIYFSGNNDTHNYKIYQTSLSYIFMPKSTYYGTVYASTDYYNNRIVYTYNDYSDGNILRMPQNDGSYFNFSLGMKNNLYLLNKSLTITASPKLSYTKSTGMYVNHLTQFSFDVSATYYIHNYFFNLYYKSRNRYLSTLSPIVTKTYDTYGLYAGWSNNSWNLNVSFNNFLRYNWKAAKAYFTSPVYSINTDMYTNNTHANVQLSVTYTINYGKRLSKRDELNNFAVPTSAINRY